MCAENYTRAHANSDRGFLGGRVVSDFVVEDVMHEEPKPGEQKKKRGRPAGSTRNTKFVKDFSAELDAFLKMAAFTWSMYDETCAGVLNETSANIAKSIAELAGQSERARRYLEKTTKIGVVVPKVVELLTAMAPLAMTIRAHHPDAFSKVTTVFPVPTFDQEANGDQRAAYPVA